jgi:hypothetical protein
MIARRLTAKRVHELLDCDPKAGTLTWKFRPDGPRQWNTKYAGKPAGTCIGNDGYARIRIDGKTYLTHRIVFLHTKGYWPPATLDHHDGNPQNRAIGQPATGDRWAEQCQSDPDQQEGLPARLLARPEDRPLASSHPSKQEARLRRVV